MGTNWKILDEGGVNKQAETFDEQGNIITPTPPKIDLRDAHAIRREIGSVYRDMRRGKIEPQDGTRLVYVLDVLRKAYETGVLQDRLELLERTFKLRKK